MENMHAALSGPVYPPEEGRTRPRTDRDLKIQRATIPNSVSGQPTAHPPGGVLNSHPLNQPPNITLNERLRNEMNVCRSDASNALYISVKNSHGTISPLPPALSPASLSPANSSNFNSSRASPAPPVIADEDELPPSLPYSSALPNRPTAPPNLTSSVDGPSKSTDYEPFEKRTRIRTPSSSCTSESTSSSSSTSSSCEDVPLRQSHTNGIPILEKMSVSLIAPKVEPTKISPTVSSPAQNSPAAALIDSPRRPVAAKVATVCSPAKEAASTDGHTLPAGEAKTEVKVDLSTEQKAAAPQATAKKRRAPAKRKRAVAKRWRRDSESDFEFDGRLGPRRAKNAVTLVKSVKEKAKRNAKGKTESKLPSGAELASRRRYLESPFFCLCQSSSSSEAPGVSGSCGGSGEATKDVLCDLPSSMPAHVVNPALKDCSSAFYSLGDPRVTSLCPLLQEQNAGRAGVGNKNVLSGGGASFASDRAANSELQSFFANSFYKPTLRPNVRDTRLPSTYSDSACGAWCCVFCGEDPDFLLMGPLYGPYFLAEPTASKLLAQQTGDAQQQQSAALSAIPPDLVITPSSPRKSMSSNSEVVSSAVTRSSAAAAAANPARPVVAANTGGLRLVIKALSPTLTGSVVVSSVKSSHSGGSSNSSVAGRGRKSGANSGRKSGGGRRAKSAAAPPPPAPSPPPPPPAPTRLRIGLGGEVWFHFECVLWASGTSIHGDGNISGLEDVVSMALEAACSHCKKPGPILSCRSRGCGLCYHFNCARLAECHFNTEQFTVLCKKHFVYS